MLKSLITTNTKREQKNTWNTRTMSQVTLHKSYVNSLLGSSEQQRGITQQNNDDL